MMKKKKAAKPVAKKASRGLLLEDQTRIIEARAFSDDVKKPPAGSSTWLIVMDKSGTTWFAHEVRHYIPNAEQKKIPYISPRSNDANTFCPAFTAWQRIRNSADPDVRKLADQIKPSDKFIVNAFRRKGEEWEHQLLDLPYGVWSDIATMIHNEVDEDDFVDGRIPNPPVVGNPARRIVITRTGEGKNDTRYDTSITAKTVKITPEMKSKLVDLSTYVEPRTIEEIEEAVFNYLGFDPSDEDAAPKRRKQNAKASARVEDADDEPEDEDDDDDVDLDEMDRAELKAYIKEQGLDVVVKKTMDDDDIRDLIRDAEGEAEEESDEEDDDYSGDYEEEEEDEEEPDDEEEEEPPAKKKAVKKRPR